MLNILHSKGSKAGIYSDSGINSCASHWLKDTAGYGFGLFGNEQRDLTLLLKDWDYDFLKVDWCGAKRMGLEPQARYTLIASIAQAIKPHAIFNVCQWQFPKIWVIPIAHSWRISKDRENTFACNMDMLQVGRGMSYEEDKTHFTMWAILHSPLLLGNDLSTLSKET